MRGACFPVVVAKCAQGEQNVVTVISFAQGGAQGGGNTVSMSMHAWSKERLIVFEKYVGRIIKCSVIVCLYR
jgi:hypothetical protein